MQGRLQLHTPDGPVLLTARVVRYGSGPGERYSWHGDLRRLRHARGQLTLDDGTVVHVEVGGAFLEVVPTDAACR